MSFDTCSAPRPPRAAPPPPTSPRGNYDGPLLPGSGVGPSAAAAQGDSPMYAPALQPMPRFMGAGPVANGSLLRSHHGGDANVELDEADKWANIGTV